MSTPPLPAGYQLDQASGVPPLPPGYQLDSETSAPPAQPGAASRFGSSLLSGLGVVSKQQGKDFFMHPIDTLKAMAEGQGELAVRAKKELQNKDYVRGLTHAVEYMLPGLGPTLAKAGDQLESGDTAGGIGTTLGAAVPIAAGSPEIQAKIRLPAGSLPDRMYQSALKPSTTLPTAEVKGMVRAGLDNQIPISAAGAEKLDGLITNLGDKVKTQIQSASKTGATVDPAAIAQRADSLRARFSNQVAPDADLAAIDATQKEFLKNNSSPLAADVAQSMKQGTYQQLKNRAYGEQGSATVEAQKALARGIKEELEAQFPEIKGLNAKQGQLIELDNVLERAVRRIDNRDIFSLGGKVAGVAGAAVGGAPGGLAGFILHHVISSPEVQSKLAIALNHASRGGIAFPTAAARVAAYSSALGQAVSAAQPNGNQSQQ